METDANNEPIRINFLSLNCHLQVGAQEVDQVYLKYNGKRIYPVKGLKYQRFEKDQGVKIEDLYLEFPNKKEVDNVVIELWYKKNLFQNALAGRFFLILNISEIGFSATQLIRSSEQDKSHYLLHWEMRYTKDTVTSSEEKVSLEKHFK